MSSIGRYEYVYGAGNAPNRKIEFFGDGTRVWAQVYGKRTGVWHEIVRIDEAQMTKEGASTKEKVRIMMEARKENKSPDYPKDKSFIDIRYKHRVNIIKNLQPTGNYCLTISNNIGTNPYFEMVEQLTFFDPT